MTTDQQGSYCCRLSIPTHLLSHLSCVFIFVVSCTTFSTDMKKKLSRLGLLFMLLIKHPPVPEFDAFQKSDIVGERTFSLRQVAMEYNLN
jgi:hypothetical protein